MKSFTASTLFALSLAASTAAHGWMGTLTVGGKAYKGNEPVEQTPNGAPSVIRQIANNLPVKDTTSPDLTCGRSAKPAALTATAAPGDTLQIDWRTLAAGGNWFHDVGPMMTYLASCGSESCEKFDASGAKWFKIDEQGLLADGTWAQAKLDNGSPASVTLPSNLKAGNYLLRHEIIALHTAQSEGGAEFYPNCAQLTVTGSGTATASADEMVSLPGAYKPTDAGILINVYDMTGAYKFPGPAVASFVKGGSSSGSGSGNPPASPPASEPSSTKAGSAPSKTGSTSAPTSTSSGSGSPSGSGGSKTCKGKRTASRRRFSTQEMQEVRAESARAPVSVPEPAAVRRHLHRFGARSF
ncbi:hypothetical protein MVEN_01574400 [Mycena venus]|uniref:lytic cellulose monooxygenase (C4-dehydrogenating) n=1 Tax=Mycena venus TaxID=2733690 RepID=A0A8H6XR13_9AGAR|nr:hypothetical protein MVEN_01574400 [Mycena venus]